MRSATEVRRIGAAVLLWALLVVLLVPGADTGQAVAAPPVRLIMVDDPNCYYCRKWNAEIGRGYAKTAEGRFAPLRRVRRGAKQLNGLAPVIFTPTFIVVHQGRELGRIAGYPGRDYFYEELRGVLAAAGFRSG